MAGRDILINLIGRETVSPAAKKAADGVDKLGDRMDATADDARRLDVEIAEAEKGLRDLAVQFARTQDAAERIDLSRAMRRQQSELRKLGKARDLLPGPEMGAQLAGDVSVSFAARLGPMLARAPMGGLNPAVAAIGAPLAAGLVTLVGTAVGGAIIGGVGVGGVVGGLALAAKDPAVKAAGTQLGADLSAMLGRASSAFVPETLDAIDSIRERALKLEPAFNRAFTSASRLVDPLVDGLLDAGENAMPGIIDALDSAGPVIDAIADGARDLGTALGEGLSDLAPFADEGARALRVLFGVMEFGVDAAFNLVQGMSMLYKVSELIGALMTGNVPLFWRLASGVDGAKDSSVDFTGVLGPLQGGLRNVGDEAITAQDAAKKLKDAFDELFGGAMGYDRAIIAYKDGIKELNKELSEGKRTLDTNTQAGRDNAGAVLDQIERIKELRDSRLEQGEATDVVNAKYQAEIGKIRAKLTELGYEKSEIDALIGKYEKIPEQVITRIDAQTIQAEKNLAKVRELIKQIKSKKVVITTQHREIVTRSEGRNVPIGNGVGGRASGGPIKAGTPYVVGEEGPELITPTKDGFVHDAKKTAQLRAALGAGRGGPAPAGGGSGGFSVVQAPPVLQINASGASGLERLFVAWLVKAVRDAGGNPQVLGLGGNW